RFATVEYLARDSDLGQRRRNPLHKTQRSQDWIGDDEQPREATTRGDLSQLDDAARAKGELAGGHKRPSASHRPLASRFWSARPAASGSPSFISWRGFARVVRQAPVCRSSPDARSVWRAL